MTKIKFYTLGCKANQYDTQSIRERFLKHGFREINNANRVDVCVINTCTVTSAADKKSRGIIRRCIHKNPEAKIIVTGCMVKKDKFSIARIKGVDYIVSKGFFSDGISDFCGHTRAFLKIQDGCDNFCAYCKVPLVRGRSRSRPGLEIIQEAGRLARKGFQEIVLTGICLGSYGRDLVPKSNLVKIIVDLEKISGIKRIRLSSIEAGDVSGALISQMAKSKKLCRHLHIPIQSGDDAILRKMQRSYTASFYLKLIQKIKSKIPGVAITTDCLVGFPGETENNFQNTMSLVKRICPLKTHIFPYSRREGTLSGLDLSNIASAAIKKRIAKLNNLAKLCAEEYKSNFLGEKVFVLFETLSKENSGYWEGYTDNYIRVLFKSGDNLKNRLIPVILKAISDDAIIAL